MLNLQSEEGAQVQDCVDSDATKPPCYVNKEPNRLQSCCQFRTVVNQRFHMNLNILRVQGLCTTKWISTFPIKHWHNFLIPFWDYKLSHYQNCWTLYCQSSPLYRSPPQRIVALYWLRLASITLTTNPGLLVLFHYLPLFQLKEVRISLAGHSLRLMGTTEVSILGVYTHSQKLTKQLCRAILSMMLHDNTVSQHPLLHGDLQKRPTYQVCCWTPVLEFTASFRRVLLI